jgi:hypothetical protein
MSQSEKEILKSEIIIADQGCGCKSGIADGQGKWSGCFYYF